MRIKIYAITGAILCLVSSSIAAPAPQNDNSYDCSAGPTVYITEHPIDTVDLSLEQPTSTAVATLYSTLVVTATTSPEASTVYITLNPIDTIEIGSPSVTHALTSTLTSTETVLATNPALFTSTENVGTSSASALVSFDVTSSIASLDTASESSVTVVILTSTIVASPDEGGTTTPLTSTETVHSTVFVTEATTVFTTLASSTASKVSLGFSSGAAAASAIGSSFTGVSPVGWNVTSAFSVSSLTMASSAPVLSSSADAVAGSYIVSTVSDEPSLYQPWVPPASRHSSFAARSGFGGGYGMVSRVSPVTATQPAFVSATIDGSVVSWPNPYYTGIADSTSAASTISSAASSVDPVSASALPSSPIPYYIPVGTGTSRFPSINSTTLSTSSIAVSSSSAEAAGSSTLSPVVYYTPSGTAYSTLTVSSVDSVGSGTSSSSPIVYYTPPGTAYSSLTTSTTGPVSSSAPVVSSTADACASACMTAYNACRGQVDPNMSTCAAEYASCLGYSPFDNDGSLITPTACSTTADATSTSAAFGSASSASISSSPVVYYTPPSFSDTSSSVYNTVTSADPVDPSTAPTLNSTILTSSSTVSSNNSSLYSSSFITSSYASQSSNTAPVENSTVITSSSNSSQTSVFPISSSASSTTAANSTTLTGSSGSSQISVASASSKASSISVNSSYTTSSFGSSGSLLSGNAGGYSFRPQSTASRSGSSVTTVSPESGSTVSQSSTLSASVRFSLNSSSLTTFSLPDSSASAVITTSYGGLLSSSVNHSTVASSTGYAGLSTANTTSTSGSTSSTPTSCGEHGSFTLNWDDLPTLVANNLSDPNTIQPPPIFNPYHQFWFSSGFVDVPLPKDPYNPSSPPHLLEFITNFDAGTDTEAGPDAIDLGTTGEVGNGPYMSLEYLAFNATGASMGCDSTGPDCSFQFTGLRYDPSIEASIEVTTQMIDIPACPALNNCDLVPIVLDETFISLSALRINVTVDGIPKIWFMDDLELGWFNNTCAAGLARQSHR